MTSIPAEDEDEDGTPDGDPDEENTFTCEATSGAGGGNVGLAGAASINVITSEAKAYSAGTVTLTGAASISAQNAASGASTAGTTVSGEGEDAKVGVGASFALNSIINNILAYVADGTSLTGATNISITSTLVSKVETTATAGADPFTDILGEEPAEGQKVALDAAVALTIVTNNVKAYSGAGSTLGASGTGTFTASTESDTDTRSEGNSNGSKVAVGASVALNIITATTEAAILGNASFGGNLTITSTSVNTDDVNALATARGLKIERYINQFKTTADQILSGDFGTSSEEKKPKSAETLNNQGANTPATTDQNGGSTGSGSQSSQSISVAAAVGVNVTLHSTLAHTSGVINAGGSITISATSTSDFETLGTGAAVTDGNSIAVGVAVSNIYNETTASLGSVNSSGGSITIRATSSQNMSDEYRSKLGAQGIAGAVSGTDGKIGVAGALALINSNAKTSAYIAPNAVITNAGAISISAQETSKLAARAWAAAATINGQSVAGVGATFVVIYSNNEIKAYVGSGASVTAASLSLSAEKKRVNMTDFSYDFDFEDNDIPANIFEGLELVNFLICNNYYAEAIAGSASAGTVAVAGAFVVVIFNNVTEAYVDGTATVTLSSNLSASANSDINAKAFGGSVAAAEKAGIGITVVNIINNDRVCAYIGSSANVHAANISLTASAKQEMTMISVSGSGASNTGVAGIFGVLVSQNTCEAFIGDSAVVVATGSVTISADNDTWAFMIAGGGTGGGTAGVGGSLAAVVILNHTSAYIGNLAVVTAAGSISISADAYLFNVTAVISGSGGGEAGVAASIAVKVIQSTTLAYIGYGGHISAAGISIKAKDNTVVAGVSGSGSGGGTAGVGASNDTNVVLKTVKAYIADGTVDSYTQIETTGNLIIEAASSETIVSVTAGFAGGGSVGVGGAVGVTVSTNDIAAYIGSYTNVEANGSVAVSATDDLVLVLLVGSGAGGGSVGVGGAIGVSVIVNAVKAFIADYANVTALGNGTAVEFYTGAAGKAKDSARGVLIGAYETEDIIAIVVSGSGGGSAGVAASVCVTVVDNDTYAYIGDGALINENNTLANALQQVRVVAVDDTLLVTIAGGGSGGGAAGVGAVSDTTVLSKDTQAFIGAGLIDGAVTVVNAKYGVTIRSLAKQDHVSVAAGFAGGGSAGVAGALSVSVMSNNTVACANAANISSLAGITINAVDDTVMALAAGSGAGGGAAGVGASFAVGVVTSTTAAYLGGGSTANAKGLLEIKAESVKDVITVAVSGSGAGAAGIAGVHRRQGDRDDHPGLYRAARMRASTRTRYTMAQTSR